MENLKDIEKNIRQVQTEIDGLAEGKYKQDKIRQLQRLYRKKRKLKRGGAA